MGSDLAGGEVLQLFVEGGWWKASEHPAEDRGGEEERTGALVSEVVVPGEFLVAKWGEGADEVQDSIGRIISS